MPNPLKVVACIPARLSSTRLPAKVLRPILGKPMLEHQIARIKRSKLIDEIVVATTDNPSDAPIVAEAARLGVHSFAGSETDVLDRLYQAARERDAHLVLRLTGDGPLVDAAVIDEFVQYFLDHIDEVDYVDGDATYPDGQDVEVFSFEALERTWKEAERAYEREHVSVYTWQSGRFRTVRRTYTQDLSEMRWEVNEAKDLEFVTAVYKALYPKFEYAFGIPEILDLLDERPELLEINHSHLRNEGFLTSLREERVGRVKQREGGLDLSEQLWRRAQGLIPAGTQTLSKGPTQYVDGVAPKYLQRAEGCRVWDVDGNEYIDYPMGLGAVGRQ